jgi:hypothetical protein
MSRAIASARQRRAGLTAQEPPAPPAINQPTPSAGLTLQQVISLIDTRLTKLEKSVTANDQSKPSVHFAESGPSDSISQILDDFNARFIILAEEMAQLKDTLMKLQTYTMDVNKMLLEERVNVLSDLGEDKSMYVMGDTCLSGGDFTKFEPLTLSTPSEDV